MRRSSYERFWEKVEIQGGDACWNWTASKNAYGYGTFWHEGRVIPAHHFLLAVRPPSGQVACHHCDNPKCVRPSHIFVGTKADNAHDMIRKGRHNPEARSRNCKKMHGHRVVHRGSGQKAAKLSEADAAMILAVGVGSGLGNALARRFGISHAIISGILHGRRWRHVAPDEISRRRAEEIIRELRTCTDTCTDTQSQKPLAEQSDTLFQNSEREQIK